MFADQCHVTVVTEDTLHSLTHHIDHVDHVDHLDKGWGMAAVAGISFFISLREGDTVCVTHCGDEEVVVNVERLLNENNVELKHPWRGTPTGVLTVRTKGPAFLPNSGSEAVIIHALWRGLEEMGHSVTLRWVGGMVLQVSSSPPPPGDVVYVSCANDKMDVVGLDDDDLAAIQAALVDSGVRVQKQFVENAGAMQLKLVSYPFMRPEEQTHVLPVLLSAMGSIGCALESAAGSLCLAFRRGGDSPTSVAWSMVVGKDDLLHSSPGSDPSALISALEDTGFVVKKRAKPHKLYKVDVVKFKGFPWSLKKSYGLGATALFSALGGVPNAVWSGAGGTAVFLPTEDACPPQGDLLSITVAPDFVAFPDSTPGEVTSMVRDWLVSANFTPDAPLATQSIKKCSASARVLRFPDAPFGGVGLMGIVFFLAVRSQSVGWNLVGCASDLERVSGVNNYYCSLFFTSSQTD